MGECWENDDPSSSWNLESRPQSRKAATWTKNKILRNNVVGKVIPEYLFDDAFMPQIDAPV
jgi:hypothetical protein